MKNRMILFLFCILLFSCRTLPRNQDTYLCESRLTQVVMGKDCARFLHFENGVIISMRGLETKYMVGAKYRIYRVTAPAPEWLIKKSGIVEKEGGGERKEAI